MLHRSRGRPRVPHCEASESTTEEHVNVGDCQQRQGRCVDKRRPQRQQRPRCQNCEGEVPRRTVVRNEPSGRQPLPLEVRIYGSFQGPSLGRSSSPPRVACSAAAEENTAAVRVTAWGNASAPPTAPMARNVPKHGKCRFPVTGVRSRLGATPRKPRRPTPRARIRARDRDGESQTHP